jgi:serine/threonine-protein kinase
MIQIGIAAAAVVGLVLLVIALFSLNRGDTGDAPVDPTLVTIPILDNRLQADAEAALTDLGLEFEIEEESSDDVEVGRVIRSDPDGGEQVEEGATVTLYVSAGADVVNVPDVKGLTEEAAREAIEAEGLTVSTTEVDHSPDIEAGRATKTDPAVDTEVERDSSVILYVSDGQVELPELRKLTTTEAQALLIQLGLVADPQEVETTEANPNTVVEMSPLPGLVPQRSTVTITIAKAPTTVAVPDVRNKSQVEATNILQSAGLTVGAAEASSETVAKNNVISQDVAPGTSVAKGTKVTITVSTGPAPVVTPDPEP